MSSRSAPRRPTVASFVALGNWPIEVGLTVMGAVLLWVAGEVPISCIGGLCPPSRMTVSFLLPLLPAVGVGLASPSYDLIHWPRRWARSGMHMLRGTVSGALASLAMGLGGLAHGTGAAGAAVRNTLILAALSVLVSALGWPSLAWLPPVVALMAAMLTAASNDAAPSYLPDLTRPLASSSGLLLPGVVFLLASMVASLRRSVWR